jgi:transposase
VISTQRARRRRPNTQDGRELRHYRHRWKVERLFAWLRRFRRIVTRWEVSADNFLGLVQLGCISILLRRL